MDQVEVEQRLKRLVSEELGLSEEEIKPGSNFIEDLGCDSLDIVELVMVTEEEFEVELPDEKFQDVKTFGEVVAIVAALMK
jgi:acyl carrier protein